MEARVEKLVNEFEKNGWQLVGPVDISNDWWFDEIIQLVSLWKPVGKNLYLTTLTDPQITDKKIVWCIGISDVIPDNKIFKYLEQIALNDIKKENLKLLTQKINNIVLN